MARVALAGVVLGHERDRLAVLGGDLLRAVLEDDVAIAGGQRVAVVEVDLVLAEVALAFGVLHAHARAVHGVADRAQQRLDARRPEDRVVHVVAVGRGEADVALVPCLLVAVLEQDELQLGAGVGRPAALGEAGELAAQHLARGGDDVRAVLPLQVDEAERRGGQPRHRHQGGEVGRHHEVAVAARPRGHGIAVDRVHLHVDGQQVVAGLGAVGDDLVEKEARVHALALQPSLHVGQAQQHRVDAAVGDLRAELVERHRAKVYAAHH